MLMRGQHQTMEIKSDTSSAPGQSIEQEINLEFLQALNTDDYETLKNLLGRGEKLFPLMPVIPDFNIEQFLNDVFNNKVKDYLIDGIKNFGIFKILFFTFKGDSQFPLVYQLVEYKQVNILKYLFAGMKEFSIRNKLDNYITSLCTDITVENTDTERKCDPTNELETYAVKWHNFTLLHHAVLLNNEQLVVLLLQHGFKPTHAYSRDHKATPLNLADIFLPNSPLGIPVSQGIYSLLYKAGDNFQFGEVSLVNVIAANYGEMLDLFLTPSAQQSVYLNVNYKGAEEWNYFDPLLYAAYCGKLEVVQKLLTAGADPNSLAENKVENHHQETALHGAIRKCHSAIAKLLIEDFKANINIINESGITPLHYAAFYHANDILALLCCQAGVNLDAQDAYGNAAIHYAVLNNNIEGINILKKAGADLKKAADLRYGENGEFHIGLTIYDCAVLSGHYGMFQHLKKNIGTPVFGMNIEEKAVTKFSMQIQRTAVAYLEKRFTDGFLGFENAFDADGYYTQMSIRIGSLNSQLFGLWRIFNSNEAHPYDYLSIMQDMHQDIHNEVCLTYEALTDLAFLDFMLMHQQDQQKRQHAISIISNLVFKNINDENNLPQLRLMLAWSHASQYEAVINTYLETSNELLTDSLSSRLKENAALDRRVMDGLRCGYITVRENEKFNAIVPFMQTCKNPFTKVPLALTCAIMSFLRPDVSYKDADNQTQYIRTERWFKAFKNARLPRANSRSTSLNTDLAGRTRFYEQFFSEKKSSPSDSKSDAASTPSNNTQSPSNSNAPNNTESESNKRQRMR